MKLQTLSFRNKQTGKLETIEQQDLELLGWGFHFFTDTETEAYKAAYLYRDSPHGVKVEFAQGAQKWMVTVFNEIAKEAGIDGAK